MKNEIKRPTAPVKPVKPKREDKPVLGTSGEEEKDKLTEKMDQKIKRHELIQKQSTRTETRREQKIESVVDRKDDLKLEADETRRPPSTTTSDGVKR